MKEKGKLNIVHAGLAFLVGFVLSQASIIIGTALTQAIMGAYGKSDEYILAFFDTAWGYLLQAIFLNISFIAVFIYMYKKFLKKEDVISSQKNGYKYWIVCAVIGVLTMFLLSGTLNYFQLFLDKIGMASNGISYTLDSPAKYIISLISLAVIPAVCEELFFRGVIVNTLKTKGNLFAIFMSAVMFSLFHFSLSQLIYPFCFGLILAIVYLKTKNILLPILLHFTNNALSVTMQYFSSSSGVFTHSISVLIYAVITLIIWVAIIYHLFKDFICANKKQLSAEETNVQSNIETSIEINNQNKEISSSNHEDKTNNLIYWGCICLMFCIYIVIIFL